ncbi:hypothetical protein [Paenibacillus sp. MBLB4367]|uniref:hypothetical protein n=1 Tax=Paenibacillus sp. MBLB4367 TaxID=3384767 RepID=UPI0039080B60
MTVEKAIRFLAFIAVLGGVARGVMTPLALILGTDSIPELYAGIAGSMLLTIGTVGVYLFQAASVGRIGLIAFTILTIGNLFTTVLVSMSMYDAVTGRSSDSMPPAPFDTMIMLNMIFLFIGFLAFGIVSMRAKKLPIWASIMLLASPITLFIPGIEDWSAALWGLSYVGFGLKAMSVEAVKPVLHGGTTGLSAAND